MIDWSEFPKIRVADAEDEGELMHLCERLSEENALSRMSHERVRNLLRSAISGPVESRKGIVGAIGKPGQMEGSIYLEIAPLWYSEDPVMMELWSFVLPEFRRSSNSKDLIKFAKAMSDHFTLPLMIGVLSNTRTEAKIRHYRSILGEPAGAFFLHGRVTGGVH